MRIEKHKSVKFSDYMKLSWYVCARSCACVRASVRACVRACEFVRLCMCMICVQCMFKKQLQFKLKLVFMNDCSVAHLLFQTFVCLEHVTVLF